MSEAAKRLGYDFHPEKIDWGSSSRMGTAHLDYKRLSGEPDSIKIQVNFIEPLVYETQPRQVRTLISAAEPKALQLLDDDDTVAYRSSYSVQCYDPKEIAAEKCRAILTRKAAKGRDVLDLFLLERDLGIRVEPLEGVVRAKLELVLSFGDKYADNLDLAARNMARLVEWDVKVVALKSVDEEAFSAYRTQLIAFLQRFVPTPLA